MKVSPNSWHYKLAEKLFEDEVSNNLCTYFWQVAGPIIVGLAVLVGGPLAVYSIIMDHGWALLWMIPLFAVGIVAFVGMIIGIEEGWGWTRRRLGYKPKDVFEEVRKEKEKKPNLLWEYIKAKKAKVCPLIDFE